MQTQHGQLLEAAKQAVEAFRYTREYVGVEKLPALPGWSWYDAKLALEAAIVATEANEIGQTNFTVDRRDK